MTIIKEQNDTYSVKFSINKVQHYKRGFNNFEDAKIFGYSLGDYPKDIPTWYEACLMFLGKYKNDNKLSSFNRKRNLVLNTLLPLFEKDKKINKISLKELNYITLNKFKNYSQSYCNKLYQSLYAINKLIEDYYSVHNRQFNLISKVKHFDNIENLNKKSNNSYLITEDYFNKFISNVDNLKFKVFFILSYYSGMRYGEIVALKVKDINFNDCTISINKTAIDIKDKGYLISTPKTKNSIRDIYIGYQLIIILKDYIDKNNLTSDDLLFSSIKDKKRILSHSVLSRTIKHYCFKSNLKQFEFKEFRKSYTTRLLENNIPQNIIIKNVGHSTIDTTTRYYIQNNNSNDDFKNYIDNNQTVLFDRKDSDHGN